MVNILYLSHTGSIVGGCENRLIGLIKNLDRNLYNPIVVCSDAGKFFDKLEKLDLPVHVCHLPRWRKVKSYPFRRLSAMRLAKLAKKYQIDLIHTSNLWSNYYAWRVGQALEIPIVSHARDLLQPERIHKYLFDKFDKIIAISERTKEPLVLGGVPSEKIVVVYNGIDLSKFRLNATASIHLAEGNVARTNVLRKDHSLRKHLVGLIGRIEPFKRQKEFVQVIAEIVKAMSSSPSLRSRVNSAKECPRALRSARGQAPRRIRHDVSFLFIGEPPPNRSDYFREVQQTIEKYDLSESITFTGYRQDMPEVLASLDLLVSLSAGGVIMEAMASGLPVVGTDIASASAMIDDGVTGFLLPQDDIRAVSKSILRLLENEKMRDEMGKAGRKRVEEFFDVRKNTRLIEAVYGEVLGEWAKG